MKRSILALTVMAAAFALAMVAAISTSTETAAASLCICPDIYRPVICSNGKVYENGCWARCDHATNCVPTGGD